jgi:hypothetical protein
MLQALRFCHIANRVVSRRRSRPPLSCVASPSEQGIQINGLAGFSSPAAAIL